MDNKTLENLRLDLIEELKAVNQYQKHIDETDNQEVKKVLSQLMALLAKQAKHTRFLSRRRKVLILEMRKKNILLN